MAIIAVGLHTESSGRAERLDSRTMIREAEALPELRRRSAWYL